MSPFDYGNNPMWRIHVTTHLIAMKLKKVMSPTTSCTIILLLLSLAIFCTIYQGVRFSLNSEIGLIANRLTVELLRDYIKDHGEWPTSWEDMESLPPRHRGGFKWPEDRKKLQRHVHIDFDKNLDELAKEAESGQFTAVRPKRLTFPEAYDSIEWLGEFIQDHRATAAPIQPVTDETKTEDETIKPEEK